MPSLTSRIVASLAAARRCFLPSTPGYSHAGAPASRQPALCRSLDGEPELLVVDPAGRLESRNPDAEQADRPRRREAAEEAEGHGPTRSADATASVSVRARVWVEKSSSLTLIPIVRPRRP